MSVIVWTKTPCVQCGAVKRAFKAKGVAFVERDLTLHPAALENFKEQGLMQAPIVEAEGHKTFSGYEPDSVKAIIASHGVEQ